MTSTQASEKWRIEKHGRGYRITIDGEPAFFFRTKRLAKKFLKGQDK